MQPRLRILAVSLAAALTLVSAGCGTEGNGDDAADGKKSTTTVASNDGTTEGGDPVDTTEPTEPTDDDPFVPSGDDGEAGPYVEALKRSMHASNEADDAFEMADDQIDCMAPRFIDVIGADRLKENGVTPADLESGETLDFSEVGLGEKEGNALFDTFGECDIDLNEMMMASMAADEDMTPEMKTCMEGVFTDDNLRKLMVATMTQGDDALENDPLMAQLMGCAFMGMEDMGGGTADMPSSAPDN